MIFRGLSRFNVMLNLFQHLSKTKKKILKQVQDDIYPLLLTLFFIPTTLSASPSDLVADLSHHLIAIHTDFKGMDIVLFGSTESAAHIVVTVKGPRKNYLVQRKEKRGGMWAHSTGIRYYDVPSFFRVASDAPLEEILPPTLISRFQFTPQTLDLEASKDFMTPKYRMYKEALIDQLQRQDYYGVEMERVKFLGPRLFRSILHFPSNVPPGIYQVIVYLIQEGQITDAQSIPLSVNKVGLSSDLYSFANKNPVLYGLMAVFAALFMGIIGGLVLRRSRH